MNESVNDRLAHLKLDLTMTVTSNFRPRVAIFHFDIKIKCLSNKFNIHVPFIVNNVTFYVLPLQTLLSSKAKSFLLQSTCIL